MACVTIDEKRRKVLRNACCCCYTHSDDYTPEKYSELDLQQRFFENIYGPLLIKLPVKVFITFNGLHIVDPVSTHRWTLTIFMEGQKFTAVVCIFSIVTVSSAR